MDFSKRRKSLELIKKGSEKLPFFLERGKRREGREEKGEILLQQECIFFERNILSC